MLEVGDRLVAVYDGYFSVASNYVKVVEALGDDWVVVRRADDPDSEPEFACGTNVNQDLWNYCERNPNRFEYGKEQERTDHEEVCDQEIEA